MNYQWSIGDLKGMSLEGFKWDGMLDTKIKYYGGNLVSSIKIELEDKNYAQLLLREKITRLLNDYVRSEYKNLDCRRCQTSSSYFLECSKWKRAGGALDWKYHPARQNKF